MENLKLHSKDLTAENIDKIAELFPNCVTEAEVPADDENSQFSTQNS